MAWHSETIELQSGAFDVTARIGYNGEAGEIQGIVAVREYDDEKPAREVAYDALAPEAQAEIISQIRRMIDDSNIVLRYYCGE